MEKRSQGFLKVAFYLSKFGVLEDGDNYPSPPKRLKTKSWNIAYRIFYEKLGSNRSILSFERSLKNARDAFDSHFPDSRRIGWRVDDQKPNPLTKEAQIVFDAFNAENEEDVWFLIKEFADLNAGNYIQEFEDLISVQESEAEYKKGRTEGGIKIRTSIEYERKPSLKNDAIKIHGLKCSVCGFDFEEFYGKWGKGFIEVHHVQALAENNGVEVETDPKKDLAVVCANCHRMIHRKKNVTLTIQELKEKIKQRD